MPSPRETQEKVQVASDQKSPAVVLPNVPGGREHVRSNRTGEQPSQSLTLSDRQREFLNKATHNFSDSGELIISNNRNTDMHEWLRSAMGKSLGKDFQGQDIESVIKEFQRANPPLRVDGRCGPRTLYLLMSSLSQEPVNISEYSSFVAKPSFVFDEKDLQDWLSQKEENLSLPTYIPGIGETTESYSMEDATLQNIPQDIAQGISTGAARHGYKAEDLLRLVNAASKKYKLPPILALRIIQKESDFNPNCKSGAGAMGLMQLMPENCTELGVTNAFDLAQNIDAGVRHFSDYYKKYNNLPLTLAAYNAGPGNVSKYGGIPPFRETRDYVAKIMGRLSESLSGEELEKYKAQNNADTLHQRYSWDCGPTAHANMLGEMLGLDKDKLASIFRDMQGSGGMSWANPARFKKVAEQMSGKKVEMIDLDNASADTLAQYLEQGWQITGSFNQIITRNGHITHLSAVKKDTNGGSMVFRNEDPNARNSSRGHDWLSANEVQQGGRQFWAFRAQA
jgi:hypothetical protein